jgi:hypothetical protein
MRSSTSSSSNRPGFRSSAASRWTSASGLGLLAGLALAFASCDSPACVFSAEGCSGTGAPSGALGAAAARPAAGNWILPTAPTLQQTLPTGGGIDPRSAVVLRFSESLAPSTVVGAFQLRTAQVGGTAVPLQTQTVLVGDGRVVVLVPTAPMPLSTAIQVVLLDTAAVTDLTGQALPTNPGAVLSSFTVAAAQIDEPSVVATFPPDGAFDQSEVGEIVVVFDRDVDLATIDDDSWVVQVDAADPVADPLASPAQGQAIFGVSQPIPRVWRWRSTDAAGVALPLGREVDVELTLSPTGFEIADDDANALPETTISYRTASVLAPSAIRLVSSPDDAIGIANLTPGSGNELVIEVDVDSAEDGDRLDIYLTGPNPSVPGELLALRRAFDFTDPGPIATAQVLRDGLDLTSSVAPLMARFGDGNVTIAATFTAGPITTPAVLFDANPALAGNQPARLDTVAPEILLLDRSVDVETYVHDAGDVVFEGVASEALAGIEVTTTLGSSAVGARAFANGTRFASEPIDIGVIPSVNDPLPYSLVAFDAAGNASSVAIFGTLTLRGYVGDTALAPAGAGDPIQVEVFDALTLEPLAGAIVFGHAVPAGGGTPTFVDAASSNSEGGATITSHASTDAGTIVTVALDGYDMVSLHRFGSARLSVPLVPIGGSTAELRGSLTGSSATVQSSLVLGDLAYSDGRRGAGLARPFTGSVCTVSPFGDTIATCPFGPQDVRAARSGSVAAFNGVFDIPQLSFAPTIFLSTFDVAFPVGPIAAAGTQTVPLAISRLLADPSQPPASGAIDFGPLMFDATGATGIDLGSLVDDPLLAGEVRVWVEADIGGSAPAVPAGLGVSYDAGGGTWNLRGALIGSLSSQLDESFSASDRLSVAVEAEDTNGAIVGVRASLTELLLAGGTLTASGVPTVNSPTPGTDVGSGAFTVELENSLLDGAIGGTLGSGLYALRLEDSAGRGWTHYRPDVPDGDGDVVFSVPNPADAGATPLASGSLTATGSAFAWIGFDPLGLYFSDLETEPALFSTSPPLVLSIP